jgi:hypothetical protein
MSDELESTLRESLTRHAAPLGRPVGEIDTVYELVTHRRQRRRAVAGVGSLVIAAVGVVGIVTVGQDGGGDARVAGGVGDAAPAEGRVWGCTGYLGGDAIATYYSDCAAVDAGQIGSPCAELPPVPTTTAVVSLSGPTTTMFVDIDQLPIPEAIATSTTPSTPCVTEVLVAPTTTPMCLWPVSATLPDTVAPTSASDCVFDPQEQQYVVVEGDSLFSIAAVFDIDPTVLVNYNSWPEGIDHPIFPGDVVKIPPYGPTGNTYPYLTDTAPATMAAVEYLVESTSPPPTTALV